MTKHESTMAGHRGTFDVAGNIYIYIVITIIIVPLSTDDDRAFGFVRVITGDELSKRAKFVLITWCGANVGALKRARMSTDKSEVKKVIQVGIYTYVQG